MKNLYIFILILSGSMSYAQTELKKRYEVSGNQSIQLEFDDASIISIEGWQENYISIEGKISINGNTQNDKYIIKESSSNGNRKITGYLKDKENIPRVISIKKGDELFTFNTDDWSSPEIRQFYEEHGRDGILWKSQGISWEINLTIKVPKNHDLVINSKHGMVELDKISGNVDANSIHGGIDLTVNSGMKSMLNVKTKWGEIYSNVDLKIDKESSSNRDWNHVVASVNGGKDQTVKLESKHANIYLRKE